MINYLRSHYREVRKTIKIIEIEETFDLYFSRFFGLYFAKFGKRLGMTPTGVSLVSLVLGMAGGLLFYYQQDLSLILIACVLLSLAGVLDSADGQLARMTNSSTELGRMIDGAIDNFVFMSIYAAAGYYVFLEYGWYYVALTILAMMAHSYKSALYDLYKSEFRLLVGGEKDARTPSFGYAWEQAKQTEKLIDKALYLIMFWYTGQQLAFARRSKAKRDRLESLSDNSEEFVEAYRQTNARMLSWWALVCGTNTHRTLIMITSLFGRIDLYFFASVGLFVPMLIIEQIQRRLDNEMLAQYE